MTFKRDSTLNDVNEHPEARTYMNIPQEIWKTAVALQMVIVLHDSKTWPKRD